MLNTIVLSKSEAKEIRHQLTNIGAFKGYKYYLISSKQLLWLSDDTKGKFRRC